MRRNNYYLVSVMKIAMTSLIVWLNHIYLRCLWVKLKIFVDNNISSTSTYVAIVGVFYANCSRQSVFGTILQKL